MSTVSVEREKFKYYVSLEDKFERMSAQFKSVKISLSAMTAANKFLTKQVKDLKNVIATLENGD